MLQISAERLPKRRDFLAARDGARAHTPHYVLQLRDRNDGSSAFRVGYTVTKRVGNAVVRNRIRRRLRAAVAESGLTANLGGHDAVIIARDSALHAPYADLVKTLGHAFKKAVQKRQRTAPSLQNCTKAGTSHTKHATS